MPRSKRSAHFQEANPNEIQDVIVAMNQANLKYLSTVASLIEPAFDLATVLPEHGRLLVTLIEAEWAARLEASAGRQVDQARRLPGDEHRVGVTAQARDTCHQHLRVRM